MKTTRLFFVFLFFLSLILGPSVFPQGSLTPPGGPAPTMKSLDQIASQGIAINATNTPGDANNQFLIVAPGSYYLTGNLAGVSGKNGIRIKSDAVTVDLNGFDVNGTGAGAVSGIVVPGTPHVGITVRNGFVRNWGQNGVDVSSVSNGQVENVTASGNAAVGIVLGENSTVRNCRASSNAGGGIVTATNCAVENCVAELNTGANAFGISVGNFSVITNCAALSNNGANGGGILSNGQGCALSNCSAGQNGGTNGAGIKINSRSSLINCNASSNATGIVASFDCLISGCTVILNGAGGINVGTRCTVSSNFAATNGPGIHATGQGNRIDNNSVVNNAGNGILVDSTANIVIRNTANGNSSGNYNIAAGNSNARVISGSADFVNSDPTANLSY